MQQYLLLSLNFFCSGKVVINNVEVTDIDSWNKAITTFIELENKINNLQSKIDKAIEYIDYHDVIYNNGYINEKHKFDKSINPKELLDILKEVENVENN